jgi:hypothetical protein
MESSTPAAPATPHEQLLPNLQQYYFSERIVRMLQRKHVQWMRAELVSNLNEVGMSGWEDRKEKKVIVPAMMDTQTIHHRTSRSVRHISIITCITAVGEFLTPYIVTSQDFDAIRRKLMSCGVRLGVGFALRHRSKSYVSERLFLEYINIISVP